MHDTKDETLLESIWVNIKGKRNDVAIDVYYKHRPCTAGQLGTNYSDIKQILQQVDD